MNNNINIGLLGTVINNSNMGCVALTYSVIISTCAVEKIK